nr:MAG TPA: hypothetical protein [Crassvirales sp.]
MEAKELKIQVPEGYEIDRENSTFECVKFKSIIKKNITYEEICEYLFKDKRSFYISDRGEVNNCISICSAMDKNNATTVKQLKRILALNQLLNIAEYYNRLHTTNIQNTTIEYDGVNQKYYAGQISIKYLRGISAIFNRKEDAQVVIDNPNFREILDTIYKQ